ncbi:MAG: hypothetical protein RR595_06690 [Lysinibacillus sp.]
MKREPLMYITTPPLYVHPGNEVDEVNEINENNEVNEINVIDEMNEAIEESTSIFLKEEFLETIRDVEISRQLDFLSKPFQQKVYQPLQFSLTDGRLLTGTVSSVDGSSVMLTSVEKKEQELIDGNEIKSIKWRGRPFPNVKN